MGWKEVGPKPYNSSQGGLQSNAFRERMKTLHYEVAPEVWLNSHGHISMY